MLDQGSLWDIPEDSRARRKFEEFHRDNPHVYVELRKLAFKLVDRGWEHYGIMALWNVVRFHRHMETIADDGFKLNNNHTPFYARRLMENEPGLGDFFETRIQKQ